MFTSVVGVIFAPPEKQKPIIVLEDKVLVAKLADGTEDTSALERKNDRLVYALYGLTDEEIAIIEKVKI